MQSIIYHDKIVQKTSLKTSQVSAKTLWHGTKAFLMRFHSYLLQEIF